MRNRLAKWVGRSQSTMLKRGAAAFFPRTFFKEVMAGQKGFGPFCTLSFDCDFPRDIEVLPQLIKLLEDYGCRASFACIGRWVREFPDEHRALVAAGHELVNHTETHPNLFHPDYDYACVEGLSRRRFNQLTPSERREEIEQCHLTFAQILDYIPRGFRTPHFGHLHVEDVYPMLRDLGYLFSSSVLASGPVGGVPFKTSAEVWEFPVSPCPDHPFGVFDSWHSLGKHRGAHRKPGELAGLFAILGEQVERQGGYVNVYLDPRAAIDSGELQGMLQYLSNSNIEVLDYGLLVERLKLPVPALEKSIE
ncbi:MAG: hypothetical protein CME16_02495 [Gemmatimonadetes bacterium]|nr:hypothetical protein [Gemmatimonadota bacterium]